MTLIYLLMMLLNPQISDTKPAPGTPALAAFVQFQTDPPLLLWAKRLLADVRPDNTRYQHKPSLVRLKGVQGAEETMVCTDCSGLLNALLPLAYGRDSEAMARWLGSKRPLARHYYRAILQETGFTRIKTVSEIKPGDVLAIRYFQANSGNDTGHTMLVSGIPKRCDPAPPIIGKSEQWAVRILDVTGKGHGKDDTRQIGHLTSGLGEGTFRIYTDDKGAITGYAWGMSPTSAYFAPDERRLVMGRVREGFMP